jgi:hypothetical protein
MKMLARWLLRAPPEPELRKIEVFDWTEIQIALLEDSRGS